MFLSRVYDLASFVSAEVVVGITGDCPLVDSKLVNECIKNYKNSNVDYFSHVNPETYPDRLDIEVKSIEHANNEIGSEFDREYESPYMFNSDSFSKSSM